MLLKKQTVWLLTMLSLVVVLSVYYITSPEQQQNELAVVDEKQKQEQENGQEQAPIKENQQGEGQLEEDSASMGADADKQIITNAAGDEAFETLRMQLEEDRGKMKEELQSTIASTELPAEERSEAKEQMDELNAI